MQKIYVMLPCYNEELNIGSLINQWIEQEKELSAEGYELLICAIDDCSTDKTKNVILEACSRYPQRVRLLQHEVNMNLCGGLNTSISYFFHNGQNGDIMALMDGDGTHSPRYIHSMIEKQKEGRDIVIASRYCRDSNVVGVAPHRVFMSDMAKLYYSIILRVPDVKDYTCGYRVYTYQAIQRLLNRFGEDPIKEKSFACMMEFLYKAYLTGSTFDEVGFELRYDKKRGESKMKVFTTMRKSIITAIKLKRIK